LLLLLFAAIWKDGGKISPFLTSVRGHQLSVSRPVRFNPGERTSGRPSIGGWVGNTIGMQALEKSRMCDSKWQGNLAIECDVVGRWCFLSEAENT